MRNGVSSLGLRWNKRGISPRLGLLGVFSPDAGATGLEGRGCSERGILGEFFPAARRKRFVTDNFRGCSSFAYSLVDLPLEDVVPVRGYIENQGKGFQ